MVGLFRRVREGLSGNTANPPRAEAAGVQPASAPATAAQGASTHVSQKSPDNRQSPHNDDLELQRALEASELEAALAQSRLAAEQRLYSDRGPAHPQLEPAASDDEELKAAMALSEAEAKQAAKGKGIMKRTPTEEDMERALQESAKLAKSSPKHKQHGMPHGSDRQYTSRGGTSSWQGQSADDEALARALQDSAQLASSSNQATSTGAGVTQQQPYQAGKSGAQSPPSAPMMPSPAAASHVQHGFTPSSAATGNARHSLPQYPQAGPSSSSSSASAQQAPTGSVQYPNIYYPNSNNSVSSGSSSSGRHHAASSAVQSQHDRSAPLQQPGLGPTYRQQSRPQHPASIRLQPYSRNDQHQPAALVAPQANAGDLYIDGYHGSANLESMLSADEAFARAIQEQELLQASTESPAPPHPPGVSLHQQAPSHQPAPSKQHQQQQQQQKPGHQPTQALQQQGPAAAPVADRPGMCAGCGGSLGFFGRDRSTISTAGRTWHASCFRCASCGQGIAAGVRIGIGKEDNLPYHLACYSEKFDPRCSVCHEVMQAGQDNIIRFNVNPFWKERYCPRHRDDNTLQCCSCTRLCPRDQQWVTELDGRTVCLDCLATIVRDTPDAQPLYDQVLSFYRQLGMALPEKPPLMMVESAALNEAEEREGRSSGGHSHGPVFHTRGLTLTVEYRAIQQVVTRGGRRFTQPVDLSARDRYEVTAILVLYGLPWLLTGTILAHECMHAWLRLRGTTQLPLQTEEGLCQLMGLLWLESQDLSKKQGTWEERLASYFANQIRTDPSAVYGDGFKLALEAFQNCTGNLPALISHVEQTGRFPV